MVFPFRGSPPPNFHSFTTLLLCCVVCLPAHPMLHCLNSRPTNHALYSPAPVPLRLDPLATCVLVLAAACSPAGCRARLWTSTAPPTSAAAGCTWWTWRVRCVALLVDGGGGFSRVFCVQMACLGGQLDIPALRTSCSCHAAAPCGLPAVCSSPAGSERQKASGAQGERLKEATAINKSLSALGNVIMSLVDQQHVRCFGLGLGVDSVFCWWDRPADVAFAGWLTLTAWRLRVNECRCRAGRATSPTATPASLTCCKTRWAATPRPAWCVRCLAGGLLLLLLLLLLLPVDAAAAGD